MLMRLNPKVRIACKRTLKSTPSIVISRIKEQKLKSTILKSRPYDGLRERKFTQVVLTAKKICFFCFACLVLMILTSRVDSWLKP